MTLRDHWHSKTPAHVPDRAAPRFGTPSGAQVRPERPRRCYHRAMLGPDTLVILIIILIAVIIWRGPKTLPLIGRAFGQSVRGARKEIEGMKADMAATDEDKDKPA